MAQPDKQQIGDGGDNMANAARQAQNAAKQIGKAGAQKAAGAAAKAGAEATANAAAASVNAAASAGSQAVANVAAGTASGGPWGAIIMAAWSMRHTLFKILICICLCLMFLVALIVSLPSIIFDYIFGASNESNAGGPVVGISQAYVGLQDVVNGYVVEGHNAALQQVEQIIADGDYDVAISRERLVDHGAGSTNRDVCYVLAAYSVSKENKDTSQSEMESKLAAIKDSIFSVTSVPKEETVVIPLLYTKYKPVSRTVVTEKVSTGSVNGVTQYRYTIETKTYYEPDGETVTSEPITREKYVPVNIEIPNYSGSTVTGTTVISCFTISGTETLTPETKVVKFVECTIHPFDSSVALSAFGLDPNAVYGQYGITNDKAVDHMANALMSTLFGRASIGNMDVIAADGEITRIGKFPVPVVGSFSITSGYGERIHPITNQHSFHYGIDIAGAHYTQIISVADGVVEFAGLSGDTHIVKIRHTDENGKVFYSRYLHLAEILVTEGQPVLAEQVIGTEGGDPNTDIGAGSSTGPHLHFELSNERGTYNPYDSLFKAS